MIHDYLQEKIDASKDILKLAAEMSQEYYHKPLICTYSGGKDSDVLLQLAIECLDPDEFEVLNSHTTVDAPETVYYIRDKFKELDDMGIKATIRYPHDKDGNFISIWSLIVKNDDLICNPIYKWTDSEIWEFIQDRGMKYNPLYDKGFHRVGCIGCPLASNQVTELEMYPKYKQNYINAFQKMVDKRMAKNKKQTSKYGNIWRDGESVYKWWINDTTIDGQMNIYDFLETEDDGNK